MKYKFSKEFSNIQIKTMHKIDPTITVIINGNKKPINKLKETIFTITSQTIKDLEIIVINNKDNNELKKYVKKDKRVKLLDLNTNSFSKIRNKISKKSEFFTIIEAGEYIEKTYLETSILALYLNENYSITYTDTINYGDEKIWNYYFENGILKDNRLPVPNFIFKKKVFDFIQDKEISEIRTWKLSVELLREFNGIHQSYYGFLTYKNKSDLDAENYLCLERDIYSSNIINYPQEEYYYEIIKSNIEKLSITKKEKDKTNILLIIPWMVLGGADRFNYDFIRLIDKSHFEISVITDHPKEYIWRQKFEEYVEIFEMSTFLDRRNWPTFLEYMIETRNIDIIMVTNSIFGYNSIPYIKLKYPHIPVIDYIHSVELYNRYGGYGRDSSMLTSLIDKTITCSKNAEEYCIKYMNINPTKLTTVYVGVDSTKYKENIGLREKMIKKYNLKDSINIGYICRMDYPKRPLLLAEIMKKTILKNPQIKFLIGGDGPLLNALKKKTEDYKIKDNVMFFGNVEETKAFYSMCDLTLNCSIKEGIALTAYESMSMGIPLVSANVGGHKELIDESCGVLVPILQKEEEIMNFEYTKEEIQNYVDGIEKAIQNLDKYKKNCRKKIEQNFSLENMAINMQNEIKNVIKHPNKKCIENSLALKFNENMVYEYINHYLMASQYEYQTLINQYYQFFNNYYSKILDVNNKKRKSVLDIFTIIHMDKEYILIRDFIKSIIKIVLFPIRIIILEIKRVLKIFKEDEDEQK